MAIVLTIDANYVFRKWSTWLAILAAMCAAGVASYGMLPMDMQQVLPQWAKSALAFGSIISAMLVPVATSIQQKSIPTTPPPSNEEMP
jgi:hypothetical protein